jgi:hypothetical protein
LSICVGNELEGHLREVLGHQCGQPTIFTKRQQVLLVQSVDVAITVLFDNGVGDNERLAFVCCSETVHGETVNVLAL